MGLQPERRVRRGEHPPLLPYPLRVDGLPFWTRRSSCGALGFPLKSKGGLACGAQRGRQVLTVEPRGVLDRCQLAEMGQRGYRRRIRVGPFAQRAGEDVGTAGRRRGTFLSGISRAAN